MRLAAGESVVLRYTLAPGEPIRRISCQSQARVVEGSQLALEMRARRLTVHRGGTPPGAGLVVARYTAAPGDVALPPLEVMAADEIDRIARSMQESAGRTR